MPAKVTSKGQITIPKRVREALGIATGTRVEFILEEGGATLRVLKGGGARALAGALKAYATRYSAAEEEALLERMRIEVAHAAANEGRPRRHKRSS